MDSSTRSHLDSRGALRARRGWLYRDGIAVGAELDAAGALLNRYVYATHGHVPDLLLRGDTAYPVVKDQLGSVRAMVRAADGAVVQRRDYDAWGVVTHEVAPEFQSLGYAGGLEDADTKLVRFGARDYEPATGRWTCRDPIGFGGGPPNLYTYIASNPTTIGDYSGLSPRLDDRIRLRIALSRFCALNENRYTWSDFKQTTLQGLAAFVDGLLPFADPFAKRGAYDPHDNTYTPSKKIGELTQTAEIAIVANARVRIGIDEDPHNFGGNIGSQPHFQVDAWLDRVSGSTNTIRIPMPWWRP